MLGDFFVGMQNNCHAHRSPLTTHPSPLTTHRSPLLLQRVLAFHSEVVPSAMLLPVANVCLYHCLPCVCAVQSRSCGARGVFPEEACVELPLGVWEEEVERCRQQWVQRHRLWE